MRLINLLLILGIISASCADGPVQSTAYEEVSKKQLVLKSEQGLVYYGNKVFTGLSVDLYSDGSIREKIEYKNGKRNGSIARWFPSGIKSYEGNYINNKLSGTILSWWANGNLRKENNFDNGKLHGIQKQWYQSGKKFKVLNINQGKEEGIQTAWRENGKIYTNYEARDGRIYGLKRANLCYQLESEELAEK